MYKGAVFFDYDGTLVNTSEGIFEPTDKTIESLKKLKENGYLTILSTGRAFSYAPKINFEFNGYSTSNGNYITVNNEIIYDNQAKKGDILRLIERCKEMKICYGMDNPNVSLVSDIKDKRYLAWLNKFEINENSFKVLDGNIYGYKLFIMFDDLSQINQLRKEFEGIFVFDCHENINSTDVTPWGTNKGTGVFEICNHFNIDIKNTYAFGDGQNDYDILKNVGTGIAMKTHSPKLNDVANYVTETVKNEGIYKALKHFGLIND